jgi:acyl-CoA synthetase (AMP-forming)/AMP-acid ligase II
MQEYLPPSTFACLEYRACVDPGKIAFVTQTKSINYLNFFQDALRFSIALRDLGIGKGSLVVIIANCDYLHWLLLIACENNGAISVSWPNVASLKAINFLDEIDFVVTDDVNEFELTGGHYFRIDQGWLNQIFGMPLRDTSHPIQNLISLEEAQRITHSSGTTGGQKAMILTRGAQENKLRFFAENLSLSSQDSFLLIMPFSVNSTYLCATHFLRLGLTIVSGPIIWALQNFPITYFEILPIVLVSLVKNIPSDFIKPKKLSIKVIGAPLSLVLKEQSLLKICTDISGRYATNEVWPIAYGVDHNGIGTLVPGVCIEILDDFGEQLSEGTIGQIAVRSPTMAQGYYKNGEATAKHFINGYFLTGDIGRLLPSRKLQILGRCDDLLNQGGLKLAPDFIEAQIKDIGGVIDLAVTSIPSDNLFDDFYIAVIKEKNTDEQTIIQQIKKIVLPLGWQRIGIKFVHSLPTTENCKLSRKKLRQMFVRN